MSLPIVSVIIPVYRDWDSLPRCLEALDRQTLPSDSFEVVLANNEPVAGCPLERLPVNARMIHEPKAGSYAARNAAVADSRGAILAFTDSDCVPEPRWLERGLEMLRADPGARATGPIPVFREPGAGYLAYLYDLHTAFNQLRLVARGRCATANLIVSREVFDRVGHFDPQIVSGGDTEWGERASAAGVPITYDDAVSVRHPARPSLAAIYRKRRRIAGSEATRTTHPTFWYVLFRLLPPVRSYSRVVFQEKLAPIGRTEWLMLFFVHWAGRIAEGYEFLMVRLGWKKPNRT